MTTTGTSGRSFSNALSLNMSSMQQPYDDYYRGKKLPQEDMATYYYSKMELLQLCEITGKKAVSCIIDGLNDPATQNSARAGRYSTPESLYEEYLSTLNERRRERFGYAGGSVRAIGSATVTIDIQNVEITAEVLVVPNEVQKVPILVGQPYVNHPNVVMIVHNEELRFHRKSDADLLKLDILCNDRKIPILAREATEIPPKFVGYVNVTTNDDYTGTAYVEATTRCFNSDRYHIGRCVLEPQNGVLLIANTADVPLIFKVGQIIVRGEQCVAEQQTGDANEVSVNNVKVSDYKPFREIDLNIDAQVPCSIKTQLLHLVNKYRKTFSESLQELGTTHLTEMKLLLTDDRPVTYRPYRLAHSQREKVKAIIQELKDNGIIRDSMSAYASPILIVRNLALYNQHAETELHTDATVEAFTKFAFLKPVRDTKSQSVESFLECQVISIFGAPKRLITDRGTAFTSKRFTHFCQKYNIQLIHNATATPRANGQVERYNRSILSALSTTTDIDDGWDKNVEQICWGLNNTVNKSTGETPFYMIFGFVPRSRSDAFLTSEIDVDGNNELQNACKLASNVVSTSSDCGRDTFDDEVRTEEERLPSDACLPSEVDDGSSKSKSTSHVVSTLSDCSKDTFDDGVLTKEERLPKNEGTTKACQSKGSQRIVHLAQLRERALERIKFQQRLTKQRYDRKRAKPKSYSVGDHVLVRRERSSNDGASRKLLPKYDGPFVITKVLDHDRLIVMDLQGNLRGGRGVYVGVYPSEKLKPFKAGTSSTDEDECLNSYAAIPLYETYFLTFMYFNCLRNMSWAIWFSRDEKMDRLAELLAPLCMFQEIHPVWYTKAREAYVPQNMLILHNLKDV
ncbi:hypothetical protein NQ315_015971 [Exocentrus adspersus]|uniref:Integrase catalytic domain-containing protein n=1 Tax=Exocentrus adspersus TaxID=1586481 RepID=A0AAV8VJ53_9CUCU|nr:hypothetical protein NQ315_015971 [Exocentrus adspersus]